MAYPPHPMYNPYGYPAHPVGHHIFRPMPGDARNQIGHPMMHPPRLGLHHGGPFRPSRPWWNVTPSPPPHLTHSHYPHSNSYKNYSSEILTPQVPPPSSISSTAGPTTSAPISAARSKNAYSQQRARKQQLRQKQQEQESTGAPAETSNSKASPETTHKEDDKEVNLEDDKKSAPSVSENVGGVDEGKSDKSASTSPTTVSS